MPFKREVMQFLVPLSTDALGRNDLVGRDIVPVYINPNTFKINEKKIINSTLTKGGYSIQYWGEELASISAGGTTGSGGIEAVNILRMVYRNEIHVFNAMLRQRAENSQDDFINAFEAAGNLRGNNDSISSTEGGRGGSGSRSILDQIADSTYNITSLNPQSIELIPTMGAFATSIILYFQGEKFQGYFTDFSYDESAESPGLFNYSFSFTVLKRSGVRKNFLPWHRKPYDSTGAPITASLPKEGAREDELSFSSTGAIQFGNYQINPKDPSFNKQGNSITSTFRTNQDGLKDSNDVGVNRRNNLKGS